MTRLGLVTNIRNYKRRTGSHTMAGRDGTGGDTAQQSQQQNILRTTHVTKGHTRGCPRGSDPDGGTGPLPASSREGRAEGPGLGAPGGDGGSWSCPIAPPPARAGLSS